MERMRLTSIVFRIPESLLQLLKGLSQRSRIRQSEYLREAIFDLLEFHKTSQPGQMMSCLPVAAGSREVATHVLVPDQMALELRRLSVRSRVNQSDYMREAVAALLLKYKVPAPAAPPAQGVANG